MKVVYITGCLGFIGSYVTRACLSLGWYVKGVDKMTYAANKDLLKEFEQNPNFSFVKCDINDFKFFCIGNITDEKWNNFVMDTNVEDIYDKLDQWWKIFSKI
jgi:dTDP-D-glucose 4,6-dehydratase